MWLTSIAMSIGLFTPVVMVSNWKYFYFSGIDIFAQRASSPTRL